MFIMSLVEATLRVSMLLEVSQKKKSGVKENLPYPSKSNEQAVNFDRMLLLESLDCPKCSAIGITNKAQG